MSEQTFFPPKRESHTDTEWYQVVEFLAHHQLDITVLEWMRDANGRLRVTRGRPMTRPVTIHADWSEIPTTWHEQLVRNLA